MPTRKFQGAVSSGEKTSTGSVHSGGGWLTDIIVVTDGSNNAKAVITDGNGGTVVFEMTAVGNSHYAAFTWNFPIRVASGIYLTLTGTGASAIISYIKDF